MVTNHSMEVVGYPSIVLLNEVVKSFRVVIGKAI